MGITGIHVLKDEYPHYEAMREIMAAEKSEQNHDEEDVKAALERETKDGSGLDSDNTLPDSDFESFSEDGVENDHDGDNEGDLSEENK